MIFGGKITDHFCTANVLGFNNKCKSDNSTSSGTIKRINFRQVVEQLKMLDLLQKVKSTTVNKGTDFIIESIYKDIFRVTYIIDNKIDKKARKPWIAPALIQSILEKQELFNK